MFARSPKVCTNKIRPGRAPGAASAYAPARSRAAKGNWKTLHDKQRWRDLAVSVMQVGYLSDLSYFMVKNRSSVHGNTAPKFTLALTWCFKWRSR